MDPAFAKAMDGDWVVVEKEGDGEEPTSPNPSPFGGQVDQPAFDVLPASSMKSPHHGGGNRACHSNVLVVSSRFPSEWGVSLLLPLRKSFLI